jgi:hypothetical protein
MELNLSDPNESNLSVVSFDQIQAGFDLVKYLTQIKRILRTLYLKVMRNHDTEELMILLGKRMCGEAQV